MKVNYFPRTHRSVIGLALLLIGLVGKVPAQAQTGSGGKEGNIEKCERNLGNAQRPRH